MEFKQRQERVAAQQRELERRKNIASVDNLSQKSSRAESIRRQSRQNKKRAQKIQIDDLKAKMKRRDRVLMSNCVGSPQRQNQMARFMNSMTGQQERLDRKLKNIREIQKTDKWLKKMAKVEQQYLDSLLETMKNEQDQDGSVQYLGSCDSIKEL